MRQSTPFPVLGFAAFSGTGKTTLLEALLPKLLQKGVRVAMIKHAHHNFDIDTPGKDSFRLRKAGANPMLISSNFRNAMMTETHNAPPSFYQLLERIHSDSVDLLLVEGFKDETFPKIELNRKTLKKPWLFKDDPNIIALACDSHPDTDLPLLDINDISGICAFIFQWIQKSAPVKTPKASCDTFSKDILSVKDGLKIILEHIKPQSQTLNLPLEKLSHHVLSEPVISAVNVPSTTNSAMDGYAILSEDLTQERFKLVGEIHAGHEYALALKKGECVKIMTGAPLPKNADTVVMKEQAKTEKDTVFFDLIKYPITQGQNVREAGEDIQKGKLVFPVGTRICAAKLGMIASLGMASASVFSPIKVALFSTGDELQSPGSPPKANCIYDANRQTLRAMLTKLGCEILDFGIIKDQKTALEEVLHQAKKEADIIISSGGVSVGEADHIKTVLEKQGKIHFWRLNMRPGRPLVFGAFETCPFFGLPGNPVAVMVTFLEFVEPALRQMQGERFWKPERFTALAQDTLYSKEGRTEYIRGIYTINNKAQIEVQAIGAQGSGILSSMSEANCLIEMSPETLKINKNDALCIIPLNTRI